MDVSPYVLLAAATVGKAVGKKAVDTLARSSLSGISTALNRRFQGDSEVQALKAELELKTKVLLMPVDACVKHALHGNTVLQGAVDVVMEALRQIEAFEEAVQAQEMASARGDRSGGADVMTAAQACARLRKLISQLDTLVPFITMAIASSGLASGASTGHSMSPASLIFASGALTAAAAHGASGCVFQIHRARLYKEVSSRMQSGVRVIYPLSRVCVMMSEAANTTDCAAPANSGQSAAAGGTASSAAAEDVPAAKPNVDSSSGPVGVPNYALHIQQRLDDGLYHDDGETPGAMSLLISDITGLDFSTANSLGLDGDPFGPALAVQVTAEHTATSAAAGATPTLSANNGGAVADASQQQLYVIQCVAKASEDGDDSEASDQGSVNDEQLSESSANSGGAADSSADNDSSAKPAAADDHDAADDGSPQQALGRLDYVLRLCRLESREGTPHTSVFEDDRLREALAQDLVLQGGHNSPAADGSVTRAGSRGAATPPMRTQMSGSAGINSAIRDLSKLGFNNAK